MLGIEENYQTSSVKKGARCVLHFTTFQTNIQFVLFCFEVSISNRTSFASTSYILCPKQ